MDSRPGLSHVSNGVPEPANAGEQKLIDLVWDWFHREGRWPRAIDVESDAHRAGISPYDVALHISDDLLVGGRRGWANAHQDDELRLTVAGVHAAGPDAAPDLERFLGAVRLAGSRRLADPATARITAADFREGMLRPGPHESQIRRLGYLLRNERCGCQEMKFEDVDEMLTDYQGYPIGGSSWEFKVNPEAAPFADVAVFAEYWCKARADTGVQYRMPGPEQPGSGSSGSGPGNGTWQDSSMRATDDDDALWNALRASLKVLTFAKMKEAVGVAGLPVSRLSHLRQTSDFGGASKGDLQDGIDDLFHRQSPADQAMIAEQLKDYLVNHPPNGADEAIWRDRISTAVRTAARPKNRKRPRVTLDDGDPTPTLKRKRKMPKSDLVVFISHAGDDSNFVKAFVRLLTTACGLKTEQIRYTSQGSTGIQPGAGLTSTLQNDLRYTPVIVAVLSPKFLASSYCMAELGAAWGRGDNEETGDPVLFPLLAPNITRSEVFATAEFLAGTILPEILKTPPLTQLIDRIGKVIPADVKTSTSNEAITDWLEDGARLGTELTSPVANAETAHLNSEIERLTAELKELQTTAKGTGETAVLKLGVELGLIRGNAESQGWQVKDSGTALRLTSPNNRKRTFSYGGITAAAARAKLRPFVGKLRADGLRVNESVHTPVETN